MRFVVGPLDGEEGTAMGYNPNGNMSYKLQAGQATVYEWDHKNRLAAIKRNGSTLESYSYDLDGQRVKKTSAGVATYYVNQYYELTVTGAGQSTVAASSSVTQTVALPPDPVLESNTAGNGTADQKYFAYGNQRDSGPVVTDHQFTGQKQDGMELMYYAARYYDPAIGAFISLDTLVPRSMGTRGSVFCTTGTCDLFARNRWVVEQWKDERCALW